MNLGDVIGKLSIAIWIFIILNSVVGDIKFKCKYSRPEVKEISEHVIDTTKDPIQILVSNPKYVRHDGEKNVYAILPQAQYSISGYIVTKNTNFWFRDIMRNEFDDIALMDLGLVWGDLATNPTQLRKYVKYKSYKTLGSSRRLEWLVDADAPWSLDYTSYHTAHTHIIPANKNVMSALLKAKKNTVIKLDGYLVDIYTGKSEIISKTSLSRTDKDATSRGSGACEVMYVMQVQMQNKVYN